MRGIIQNGKLVIVGPNYPGAKPVIYEDVPIFYQTKYYVVQQAPVDAGSHIFMGVEICEMEAVEDEIEENEASE